MKKTPGEECFRTTRFNVDVVHPDPDKRDVLRQQIRDSITLWRTAKHKTYGMLAMAEFAGCRVVKQNKKQKETDAAAAAAADTEKTKKPPKTELVVMPPSHEELREMLQLSFGTDGRALAYGFRDYIKTNMVPSWFSHLVDALRISVVSAWTAKDQKFNATRGFLQLNHVRQCPVFKHDGLPILRNDDKQSFVKFLAGQYRNVSLSWDHTIGPVVLRVVAKKHKISKGGVKKKVEKLDKSRAIIWKQLQENTISARTVSLNIDRKGNFVLYVPWTPRTKLDKTKLNPDVTVEMSFNPLEDPDKYISLVIDEGGTGSEGDRYFTHIPVDAAVQKIDDIAVFAEKLKKNIASCGRGFERRIGSGNAKAYKNYIGKQEKQTLLRSKICREWNHIWSSRIIKLAEEKHASKIIVVGLPPMVNHEYPMPDQGLLGRPWQWSDFLFQVESKGKRNGIVVVVKKQEEKQEDKQEVPEWAKMLQV